MLQRNAKQYADFDLSLKAIAREGSNAGKEFTFTSRSEAKGDPGAKNVALKGDTMAPISIQPGGADPDWGFKLSVANEGRLFAQFLIGDGSSGLGAVATHFDLVAIFTNAIQGTALYEYIGCLAEKGFGFDTSTDKAPSVDFSGKCSDLKIDGDSVFPTGASG